MDKNMLIIHGGAPTAVMNASLYGVVMEAKRYGNIREVFGARFGAMGVIREEFLRLDTIPEQRLKMLLQTPASAIGTSRDHLEPEDYEKMAAVIKKNNIGYVLYNGGNGSMEACGKLSRTCKEGGVRIAGIPKTIDNDLAVTDHAPGFGSAARYLALTVREVAADIRSLPIHVCIIEAMGRNTGWLSAASALARDEHGDGPHLILLPERPFEEERFLSDVERLHKLHGGVLVVASEGLRDKAGRPIVEPLFEVDRSVYYGDVSAHLAGLIIRKLGIKARSEKPGLCGRSSILFQSETDRVEAELAGRKAVQAVVEGETGIMVGFERLAGERYAVNPTLIPIHEVMLRERALPDEFITDQGNDVTDAFTAWCRPLIGEVGPEFFRI